MSEINRISKEVAADRARLARTIEALTETVAPERITNEAVATANQIGTDLAQHAWSTLRGNPSGGLLVAVGAALLAKGDERRSMPPKTQVSTAGVESEKAMLGADAQIAKADRQLRAAMTGKIDRAPQASRLKAAVDAGLDGLSPAARKRVVRARQAAISAQETVEKQARRAATKASGFVQEQPLTAGALALGFGALVATLLPPTRQEDALLGAKRDALMAEARQVFEDESAKAKIKAEGSISATAAKSSSDLRAS